MKDTKKNEVQQEKKPFATPELTVYGDVAKITQEKLGGSAENFDGSG